LEVAVIANRVAAHARRFGLGWLIVAILIALGLPPFLHKGTGGASELPVYTLAGERIAASQEIYRAAEPKPFTYPPFFAVLFISSPTTPLLAPRPAAIYVAWYLLNVVCLGIVIGVIHRHLVAAFRDRLNRWLFWTIVAVLVGRNVAAVFGNHSHDLLVFLPIALGVDQYCRHRDRSAGVWYGIAAACKATPLLFVLPFAMSRNWRALAIMLASAAVATLLPDLLFPRTDGQLWVIQWLRTFVFHLKPGGPADAGPWAADSILNQSLAGTLHRLFATPGALLVDAGAAGSRGIVCAGLLGVLALTAIAQRSLPASTAPADGAAFRFGQAAAIVCGMVLLSPMSSKAHFCVVLLPIAYCVQQVLLHRSRAQMAMLALFGVINTASSKDLIGKAVGDWVLAFGPVTWATLLALIATAWQLQSTRRRSRAAIASA
jgi:Glycosyltransferase family 87